MNVFDKIRVKKPMRSAFNLSHEVKTTCNMGELVPINCQEVLPGDKFSINTEAFIRLQPLIAPMMHRVNVYVHHFFVPKRLVFEEYEKFWSGGQNGTDVITEPMITGTFGDWYNSCYLPYGNNEFKKLVDNFGIPYLQMCKQSSPDTCPGVNALPLRAYIQIYNDYYRDQNLQSEIVFPKTSTNESVLTANGVYKIKKRCWEKDYFTAALPFSQRGDEVRVPIMGEIPVFGNNNNIVLKTSTGGYPSGSIVGNGANGHIEDIDNDVLKFPKRTDAEDPFLVGDLEDGVSTSINDLRRSFAVQRFLEKSARAGARYIEQVLVNFGVKSSDSRLQRAEYLGGGKLPVIIGEVLQTSETKTTPQGTMAGHGVSGGIASGFNRYFEEHGYIISILSVIPRTGYFQGIPKLFTKNDRFDYYFPDFAHIGEQPILKKELFVDKDTPSNNDLEFGYIPRYSEYRYNPDRIAGDFRDTLLFWNLARKFESMPSLNNTFIECNADDRVFAVNDDGYDKLLCQIYHRITAIRPVVKYGDPI